MFDVYVEQATKRGPGKKVDVTKGYREGVYEISNYKPMLDASRKMISDAWSSDCRWTSRATGYQYESCL